MYLIYVLLLTLISIASTELPVPIRGVGKFRPSQNLNHNDGFLEYSQYNPVDFDLKQTFGVYGPPDANNHHHGGTDGGNGHGHNGGEFPVYPNQPIYGLPPNHNHIPGYPNKPSSYYRGGYLKPRFEKPLFSPNNGALEYPATSGQIDNYNKALQEEAEQLQQELIQRYQKQEQPTAFSNGFTGYSNLAQQPPKTYVSVKFGQPNLQYQYHF